MSPIRRIRETLRAPETDTTMLWLLPYSDFMTIMLILFAALYAFSYAQSLEYEKAIADLGTDSAAVRARKEVKLAREIRDLIKDLKMEEAAEVSITAHAIKLRLKSPVIFDSGGAELKPDIMPLLVKLLDHLRELDNTIVVEGHTDNVPIHTAVYRSNWELSAARAFSVIYFYIQRGITPVRLVAHGYGEQRPSFPNNSEFGRAMNRRIEITILRGGRLK